MKDDDGITNLFESLRSSLARAVRHLVPPREIEDIVQETWLRTRQAGGRQEIQSPRSFMFRTARNLALDYVKRAETRLATSSDEPDETAWSTLYAGPDATFDGVCSEEEFSQFCDALWSLPEQCCRVFVLRRVYGYSQKEIAKAMRISEKTVEKHISKGIRLCSEQLLRMQPQSKAAKAAPRLRVVSGNSQGGGA